MENFIFGIQAIGRTLSLTLRSAAGLKVFSGFAFGLVFTTVLLSLLSSNNPRQLPQMLLRSTSQSFTKISQKNAVGTFSQSYTKYQKKVGKVKLLFSIAVSVFLLVILVSVIRY